ncbi:hypothetical protein M5D96_011191, partial [Drosophila gunungcola]
MILIYLFCIKIPVQAFFFQNFDNNPLKRVDKNVPGKRATNQIIHPKATKKHRHIQKQVVI